MTIPINSLYNGSQRNSSMTNNELVCHHPPPGISRLLWTHRILDKKDQSSQIPNNVSKLYTFWVPKELKYGNLLNGMIMKTARFLQKYMTNFRPVFKHLIFIGGTDPKQNNDVTIELLDVHFTDLILRYVYP